MLTTGAICVARKWLINNPVISAVPSYLAVHEEDGFHLLCIFAKTVQCCVLSSSRKCNDASKIQAISIKWIQCSFFMVKGFKSKDVLSVLLQVFSPPHSKPVESFY